MHDSIESITIDTLKSKLFPFHLRRVIALLCLSISRHLFLQKQLGSIADLFLNFPFLILVYCHRPSFLLSYEVVSLIDTVQTNVQLQRNSTTT